MSEPIAIDYTPAIGQGGGIGRYTRDLVSALAEYDRTTSFRLFVAGASSGDLPAPPGGNFEWRPSRLSQASHARLWYRLRLPVPIERWTGEISLLHAPDFALPPTRSRTRTILTVHDLSFIREPWTFTPELRAYLGRVVPRSIKRADLVLVDSEATRQDVIDIYGTPDAKIRVLYSGVHDRFFPVEDDILIHRTLMHYGIEQPYLLSVGTIQPRKNFDRLVEALIPLDRPDLKLVIAGAKGWLDDPLYQRIKELKLEQRVLFLGYVPDEDLPSLYSAARVFALPSFYEGFGLPLLEAMACGVPVVTSNRSSLPEVVGQAGLIVDPFDVEALAHALRRLLDDEELRSTLKYRGQLRAQTFSWQTSARKLRDCYAELLR